MKSCNETLVSDGQTATLISRIPDVPLAAAGQRYRNNDTEVRGSGETHFSMNANRRFRLRVSKIEDEQRGLSAPPIPLG